MMNTSTQTSTASVVHYEMLESELNSPWSLVDFEELLPMRLSVEDNPAPELAFFLDESPLQSTL